MRSSKSRVQEAGDIASKHMRALVLGPRRNLSRTRAYSEGDFERVIKLFENIQQLRLKLIPDKSVISTSLSVVPWYLALGSEAQRVLYIQLTQYQRFRSISVNFRTHGSGHGRSSAV